jgi:phenylacetic acid degradation operon negative regulatory protein
MPTSLQSRKIQVHLSNVPNVLVFLMVFAASASPTAKGLIQTLLLAAEGEAFPARQLVAAGALFGISENNIRVALVRLQNETLADTAGRGSYTLGEGAQKLGQAVFAWRDIEQRMAPWNGQYIAAHVAALPRSDRSALARRDRALRMLGFREVSKGLLVRPDNLVGGVDACRTHLETLGLDDEAMVFGLQSPCHRLTGRMQQLWGLSALNQAYRHDSERLQAWMRHAEQLPPDQSAREAYLLDRVAVRQVVWDPLLPDEWVDAPARAAFFATVRDFDAAGRALWQRFFRFSEGA